MKNVLWRAKDALSERGWFQGSFTDNETGAVCALGAINFALTGNPRIWVKPYSGGPDMSKEYQEWQDNYTRESERYSRVTTLLLETINELYPASDKLSAYCSICLASHDTDDNGEWIGVATFNDNPNVTQNMIMHAFAHAAAQLDAEENDEPAVAS